jgi:hypothetical protein
MHAAGTGSWFASRAWQRAGRAAIVATAAMCVYAMRRVDPDLYGYLAYGRLFVEQGRVTTVDPFAYTAAGRTWVTFEWLSHVLLWLAYDWAGPLGLIALKCAVGGLAVYFVHKAINPVTEDRVILVPVFLVAAATLSRYFLFRPQLFTFAFFALFVSVLVRFVLLGESALWLLPPVMLVWANAHGGFLAGLGAIGLAILLLVSVNLTNGRRGIALLDSTRPLWIVLAACAAVTFANPRGVRLWQYVVTEMLHDTNRRFVAEWRPAHASGDMWSLISLTVITVTVAVLGCLARNQRQSGTGPPPLAWALSSAPLVAMAYLSVRHTPLVAIWTAPVVALLAARVRADGSRGPAFERLWLPFGGFALTTTLLTVAFVALHPRPAIEAGGTTLGAKDPCRAVQFLAESRTSGNVYTPLSWGAYVSWELYPAVRVSMDGRNISLFPRDMVIENLVFYTATASEVDLAVPFRYDTDLLLVPASFAALDRLRMDARWNELYGDRDAYVFVRRDRQPTIQAGAHRQDGTSPTGCPGVLR